MQSLSRRDFLRTTAATALAAPFIRAQPKAENPIVLPAKAVTRPGAKKLHHFFGYYDKSPWDKSGRYLLANEIDFVDRQPKPDEELTVGMIDLKEDKFIPLGKTTAWCWQQGTMLQWLGSAPDREMMFNSITDKEPSATILDVHTGKSRTLPRPIYALSTDGKQAVSLDFARLHRLRPGYGYASYPERFADEAAPEKLGVWWMDMASGKNELVINLKQLAAFKPDDRFKGAHHWVNHLLFNPGGTRFVFLHRWKAPDAKSWTTRMLTAKPDGSDLRICFDDGMVSHFDWKDDSTILAWARTKKDGNHFYTADVLTGETKMIGETVLTQDGHCSYSPDRKWILNDTYPDKKRMQWLMLFKVSNGRRYDLNKFHSSKQYTGPVRCDLHPRWNREGTQVCIDGCHDAQRQVYVIDVSEVVKS
ncbi:MAG: twin-arginine translocation signal domain-containing protein [Planctomycetia bacterium]|nr:twin-arginine translocation signal domain-containing protein [Planctomycetia bacterium]